VHLFTTTTHLDSRHWAFFLHHVGIAMASSAEPPPSQDDDDNYGDGEMAVSSYLHVDTGLADTDLHIVVLVLQPATLHGGDDLRHTSTTRLYGNPMPHRILDRAREGTDSLCTPPSTAAA
jgi:hypothetical protein